MLDLVAVSLPKCIWSSSLPMNFISPLRYPGGKNSLRKSIQAWVQTLPAKPKLFLETFGGGCSISLHLVANGVVEKALISDIDPEVACFWRVALSQESALLRENVLKFPVSQPELVRALDSTPKTD